LPLQRHAELRNLLHLFTPRLPLCPPVVSAALAEKVINGVSVAFFGCECINGTRFAVNVDGSILIPIAPHPAPAPRARPSPATSRPTAAKSPAVAVSPQAATAPATGASSDGFDAAAYAASLSTRYPTACGAINLELLSDERSNPSGCAEGGIHLGQRCWTTCSFTLQALGYPCFAAALARSGGDMDPRPIGSNGTVAFNQCTNFVPFTAAADWKPLNLAPGAAPVEAIAPATSAAPKLSLRVSWG
jgi:hypothetical protein